MATIKGIHKQRGRPERRKPATTKPRHAHHFCPNCGHDLQAMRPRRVGDLYADPFGETYWQGRQVKLSATQRLMVNSLLTDGLFVNSLALAERCGITIDSVPVIMTAIRHAFRAVDPPFDMIESDRAHGWRWRERNVVRVAARYGPLIIYDNRECSWQARYRVFLTFNEYIALVYIAERKGEWVDTIELREFINEKTGGNSKFSASSLQTKLRKVFAAVDPSKPIFENKRGRQRGFVRIAK